MKTKKTKMKRFDEERKYGGRKKRIDETNDSLRGEKEKKIRKTRHRKFKKEKVLKQQKINKVHSKLESETMRQSIISRVALI